jgi:hypothetical protein
MDLIRIPKLGGEHLRAHGELGLWSEGCFNLHGDETDVVRRRATVQNAELLDRTSTVGVDDCHSWGTVS